MDAVKLLKDDHQTVKALFRKFEKAGEKAYTEKQQICDQVIQELEVHAAIEEEIFYPAAKAKLDKDGKQDVAEGYEEHKLMKVVIRDLRMISSQDDTFDAKFKVLIENVEHHIEEEEEELLPEAQKALGNDIEALGDQMKTRKDQLKAQAAPAR